MNVPLKTAPFFMPWTGCPTTDARADGARPWMASMTMPVIR